MKPIPGIPDRFREPEATPPRSLPPEVVQIRGRGWSLSAPWVVILALASAIGARMFPTPTSEGSKLDRIDERIERLERKLDEQADRGEQRDRANETSRQRDHDELANRLTALEIRSKRQE